MSKIDMSAELGLKIKELRLKYKIKSKDLATFLKKSPAYISKLEKGDIKQIDHSTFRDMINFITNDVNGYDDFMIKESENISSEGLSEILLFYNFDWIERKIPVPDDLIDYINNKITELNLDYTKLIEYINKNEELDDDFFKENSLTKSECKENIWLPQKNDSKAFFIILNYSVQQLSDLLTKQVDISNYTFIFAIVYHLLKYENLVLNYKQPNTALWQQTADILNSNKFYSLAQRNRFLEKSKSMEEYNQLLSKFDKENMSLINQLLSALQFISDLDVKYTNEKLIQIIDNLRINPGFALAFMAIPIKEIDNVNKVTKKEFIQEVKKLIDIYRNKSRNETTVEKY